MKNTKHQDPSSREIPNSKLQITQPRDGLTGFFGFGAWNFSGAWSLVFGAFSHA
jgi:hypothetical protein